VVQAFYRRPVDAGQAPLTKREAQILELLAQGLANKEIADRLGVSVETVHVHLRRVYDKLHVRSRTEALVKYRGDAGVASA
jgi:DNA-binding NarL/FixJ family response regulator